MRQVSVSATRENHRHPPSWATLLPMPPSAPPENHSGPSSRDLLTRLPLSGPAMAAASSLTTIGPTSYKTLTISMPSWHIHLSNRPRSNHAQSISL